MQSNQKGVTLMELMIAVAIVSILATIAVPSYQRYVMRAQRTDATAALLRIAAAQEKFYLNNNTYTNDLGALGVSNTEHGWYTLSTGGTANTTGFTASATAPSTSRQFKDTDCRVFEITETGRRRAFKSNVTTESTATCWR